LIRSVEIVAKVECVRPLWCENITCKTLEIEQVTDPASTFRRETLAEPRRGLKNTSSVTKLRLIEVSEKPAF
jgi:hypothetical protein